MIKVELEVTELQLKEIQKMFHTVNKATVDGVVVKQR